MYDLAVAIQQERRCLASKHRVAASQRRDLTLSVGKYRLTISKADR
jgi:hypothetical protein